MRLPGERMPAGSVVALVLGGIAARPDYLPGLGCLLHLERRAPFVAVPMMPSGGAFDLGVRVPGEAVFAGARLAAPALPLAAARLEASNGVLLTLGR